MAKERFPWQGNVVGCDGRTKAGHSRVVILRETKLYWVTPRGVRYRKKDGVIPGVAWPMERLDLTSVAAREGV